MKAIPIWVSPTRLKSNECVEVRDQLDKARSSNSSNVRQLERLQNEVSMVSNRHSRENNVVHEEDEEETLMSLTLSAEETDEVCNDGEGTVKLLDRTDKRMKDLKRSVLFDQRNIMEAIQILTKRREVTTENAEKVAAAIANLDHIVGFHAATRRCPMCEQLFPDTVSHEIFETHVVQHFSYEESDTLTQYDTVPDANNYLLTDEELMYR